MESIGKIKLPPWSQECRAVNKLLEDRYGKDVVRNKPKFRIIWSTNETEHRFGHYNVYYMSHIFLREEVGVLEVPKYPDFPDCYVLENFVYNPISEIPESKHGHYEILYPFLSPSKKPLEPLFRVCEIIIYCVRHPRDPREIFNYLTEKDRRLFDSEVAYFKDVFEDVGGSPLVVAMQHKSAVSLNVPRNYETPTNKIIPGVIGITSGEKDE
jgi:hypothetical protein